VYRDERLKEVKPTTLKRQLGPIRHMFEVARNEWGLPLRENPLDKLQLKAPDQRRERRLKPGELDKLIATARRCRNPLIAPIILFAVATGMRRGEILGIKRGHINGGRALLIPDTKSGQARTIPLTEAAFALLH
jgi:integrase